MWHLSRKFINNNICYAVNNIVGANELFLSNRIKNFKDLLFEKEKEQYSYIQLFKQNIFFKVFGGRMV